MVNILGSSIAASYLGNAAIKRDNEAVRQAASAQQTMPEHRQRAAANGQMLEGELLNHQAKKKADAATGDKAAQTQGASGQEQGNRGRVFLNSEGGSYYQKALNQYQNNAQLGGFTSLDPLHQIDIYV